LAPRTYGTGYGQSPTHSIPTPCAQDHIQRRCTSTEALSFSTNKSVSLDRWVRRWPLPWLGWDQPAVGRGMPSRSFLAWLMDLPQTWLP
jgi:hypothetical protein